MDDMTIKHSDTGIHPEANGIEAPAPNILSQGIPTPLTAAQIPEKSERPISPFFRRIVSVIIDSLILFIIGGVLGILLVRFLAPLSAFGNFIGFGLVVVYAGVMNSRICGGATLGKRSVGIRVVGTDGLPVSVSRAVFRTILVSLPLFAGHEASVSPQTYLLSPRLSLLVICVIGVSAFGTLFFYCFNFTTRQALHDLLCKTYVVKASPMPTRVFGKTSPKLYPLFLFFSIIVIMLCLCYIVLPSDAMMKQQQKSDLAFLASIDASGVNYSNGYIRYHNGTSASCITALCTLNNEPASFASRANVAANLLCSQYPQVMNADKIRIGLVYGFDIGICKGYYGYSALYSPTK